MIALCYGHRLNPKLEMYIEDTPNQNTKLDLAAVYKPMDGNNLEIILINDKYVRNLLKWDRNLVRFTIIRFSWSK